MQNSCKNCARFLQGAMHDYNARFLQEKGHSSLAKFCAFLARTVQGSCTANLARYFILGSQFFIVCLLSVLGVTRYIILLLLW